MEDNQTPIAPASDLPEAQQNAPVPTPKNNKKTLWILSVVLILVIAAAIVFAILYFTKSSPEQPATETPTSEEEPPVSTDSEEVEITDTYVIRDLDEKIAILHDTDQPSSDLEIRKIGIGYGYSLPLYSEGNLSDVAKLSHVINAITPDKYLNQDEINAAIAEQDYPTESAKDFELYHNQGYKAETVSAKYLDVFGTKLDKGAVNGQYYCPDYYYNSTYDFYYESSLGCGGTGPHYGSYYKNKYTIQGDHAYVYISAGTFTAEDDKVYCDILDEKSKTNPPKVCDESSSPNEFKIDDTNYQDFAQYRFVFNQADNGTYYFVKVEKL